MTSGSFLACRQACWGHNFSKGYNLLCIINIPPCENLQSKYSKKKHFVKDMFRTTGFNLLKTRYGKKWLQLLSKKLPVVMEVLDFYILSLKVGF